MIDFTNCERNRFRAYGGANGNKINIRYQGKSYMLKFPPKPRRGGEMSYTNGCVSEYLGCHIFASLGFKVQETLLGTYTDNKNKEKLVVACGECPQCKKGRRNVCRTVKARGSAIDGGWREYFAVPEHEVYLLPQDMPFKDAALIEPFAIGGHCTTRAGIQGGESVLVLGSGTIGAVILQTLKLKGCRVICADINDASLARAKEYGADAIVNTKTKSLKEAVQEFTDGAGVDVIFDSACYPGSLTAVLEMGIPANGATIVPMGFCTAQEGITQAMINTRELSIIGTRMSCNQFQPTIERFAKHEYQLDGMVSHYIPFSQVGQVFENIIHPPKDMKKMVIVFDEE